MIGNKKMEEQIEVSIASARRMNMSPPHMLFTGHAGCGKTSTAKEVAEKMGTDLLSVTPEDLKDQKALFNLLDSLNFSGYNEKGDRLPDEKIKPTIVFVDECHNLPMFGQEKLGIIMENFAIETGRVGKVYWVPYFTLIGATTLSGNLSRPFLDRFKLTFFFEPYGREDSFKIVNYHASRLNVLLTPKAAKDIAFRGRGVPRIMLRYLERCRDMMHAIGSNTITSALCGKTFEQLEIDASGFNKIEIKVLKTLYDNDKPASLETLAMVTGESKKTLQNDVETYLIRTGYIVRSGQGRTITPLGRSYLEEQGYAGGGLGRKTIDVGYKRK